MNDEERAFEAKVRKREAQKALDRMNEEPRATGEGADKMRRHLTDIIEERNVIPLRPTSPR